MKRKHVFAMAVLLALVSVASLDRSAFAQPGGREGPGFRGGPGGGMGHGPMGGPGGGFGRGGHRMGPPGMAPPSLEDLERAGVTAAQRTKIERIHDESRRRMIRMQADLQIAELDLNEMVENDDADAADIDAALDRVGEMHTNLRKQHITEMRAVRALLTDEQRAKLKKARGAPESH